MEAQIMNFPRQSNPIQSGFSEPTAAQIFRLEVQLAEYRGRTESLAREAQDDQQNTSEAA